MVSGGGAKVGEVFANEPTAIRRATPTTKLATLRDLRGRCHRDGPMPLSHSVSSSLLENNMFEKLFPIDKECYKLKLFFHLKLIIMFTMIYLSPNTEKVFLYNL